MSNKIIFREHRDSSYVGRTIENASAHATIAIAANFDTAGERLTQSAVEKAKKTYLRVDISKSLEVLEETVEHLVKGLNSSIKGNLLDNEIVLNIAGNGIYTLRGKYSQEELDIFVYALLKRVIESPLLRVKVKRVRSGGQTGADEAGAKAGEKLGIETLVVCPKGWKFRDSAGDQMNEEKFKLRFAQQLT